MEDVITTGGAVRNAALALRGDNAEVSTASALSAGLKDQNSVLEKTDDLDFAEQAASI